MDLSRGRVVATLHRVNTTLIPAGETRVSFPYFLLPKMEGPLMPFGDEGEGTDYEQGRDRGLTASGILFRLAPPVAQRWWTKDFELALQDFQNHLADTDKAYELSAKRGR